MKIKQAKEQLKKFLGGKVLTFSVRRYEDNEWVAECNEIPAIMTGGMGDDIAFMDKVIREAILTAAGIDVAYAEEILRFVGYNPVAKSMKLFGLGRSSLIASKDRQAEYALS